MRRGGRDGVKGEKLSECGSSAMSGKKTSAVTDQANGEMSS